MVRRNPHVFGDGSDAPADAREVNELWESVKAIEKQRDSVTDGIAPTLPALLYADKVLDRLERGGSSASGAPSLTARTTSATGCWPSSPRRAATGTDPEQALRDAVRRLVGEA